MNRQKIVILVALFVAVATTSANDDDPDCVGLPDNYFFAVPGSCSQVYHCWKGELHIRTCPDNLWFDDVNKWCTYSGNSGCREEEVPTTEPPAAVVCEEDRVAMYPYEGDCSKYYVCLAQGSEPFEHSCPDGFSFSAEQEQCVPSAVSKCSNPGDDVHCPVLTSPTEIAYIPHPSECASYYLCSINGKYQLNCLNNLFWNPQTSSCDYPDQVQCEL